MRKGERLPEERRNLFKKFAAELKPRELMERAENPADVADDTLDHLVIGSVRSIGGRGFVSMRKYLAERYG